ncbi:MAG: nucleotidyltransferase family protein [Cyanobacteria bacterium P01_H01_bin.121]
MPLVSNHSSSRLEHRLKAEMEAIGAFCQRWQVTELALFGSVLRDDFQPESDIDVLISFQPQAAWGLLELVRMQRELQALFEREVDLLTRQSIEQSHNWIRKQAILATAKVIYAAR